MGTAKVRDIQTIGDRLMFYVSRYDYRNAYIVDTKDGTEERLSLEDAMEAHCLGVAIDGVSEAGVHLGGVAAEEAIRTKFIDGVEVIVRDGCIVHLAVVSLKGDIVLSRYASCIKCVPILGKSCRVVLDDGLLFSRELLRGVVSSHCTLDVRGCSDGVAHKVYHFLWDYMLMDGNLPFVLEDGGARLEAGLGVLCLCGRATRGVLDAHGADVCRCAEEEYIRRYKAQVLRGAVGGFSFYGSTYVSRDFTDWSMYNRCSLVSRLLHLDISYVALVFGYMDCCGKDADIRRVYEMIIKEATGT